MLRRRVLWPAAGLLGLGAAFAIGEWSGWPFLTSPLQKAMQARTGRTVQLAPAHVQLWGGISLRSPLLEISAAEWSRSPFLAHVQDLELQLRYGDVWRAYRGEPLAIQSLGAGQLEAYLERAADGRVSWQLGGSTSSAALPRVESLALRSGQIHVIDAPLDLALDADISLSSTQADRQVLRVRATGRYRKDALQATLESTGAPPWDKQAQGETPTALQVDATVGSARLAFKGTVHDMQRMDGLSGEFSLRGPSLAAVGSPFGVTLPTTDKFDVQGAVQRAGSVWGVDVKKARVGTSDLAGRFTFDAGLPVPKLSGAVTGSVLKLADLVPALGGDTQPKAASKVLPSRPFNLAALRAMDADVTFNIAQVDASSRLLEPVRPFSARLRLTGGLLALTEIDARTAQGHLQGTVALDGQADIAHWVAALRWDGVQLQRWIRQTRRAGLPPYVSGLLQGHATLQGTGRSTAELLATLHGDIGTSIRRGTVSHLLVEAGGLDLAEMLGVFVKGDEPLVLDCAVAELKVDKGVLRPRLLVLDTTDSTAWVDGELSLAAESLNLRAVTAPKDFSILTLRSPLHIQGSFAKPEVTIEKGPLGAKLGAAVLLGLLNPLAAIIPLVDGGGKAEANAQAAACRARLR